jgi:hypothetical protein
VRAGNRPLLLLAALAAVLGLLVAAAIRWVARPEAVAAARIERDQAALPFHPDDVVGLVIAPRGSAGVRLDPQAAAGLLERLSRVRIRARLPADSAALASRGLDPPAARVTVELRGGRSLVLEVGDENPYDRSRFGRREGEVLVLLGVPDAVLDPPRPPAASGSSGG